VHWGRQFSVQELTAMRELIEQNPTLKRTRPRAAVGSAAPIERTFVVAADVNSVNVDTR
jgi:hypothetical protein